MNKTQTHKKSVPEHPFRFQRWFLYCHLIYGFTCNADCIMRPLTMFSSNFIFKTNSTFTISFAYCSHASIFSAFIFLSLLLLFLASLFLFALFHRAHKYFNAKNGPPIQRMKETRKYLCCVLHVHISIENSLLVGTECIGKCDTNQHFIFYIHSQRVFYPTINSNKPKLKQLIYIQSFGSFLGFDPFRLQILFENRKIIK